MAGMSGLQTDCLTPPAAVKPPRRRWPGIALRLGCRYALGCVFLMAAVTKITDLNAFVTLVETRTELPHWFAAPAAAFLPWLELTCAACLLSGKAVREAATILAVLLVGLLFHALTHLGQPDCGCWVFPRIGTETIWWWPLLRNSALLLCGLRVLWK